MSVDAKELAKNIINLLKKDTQLRQEFQDLLLRDYSQDGSPSIIVLIQKTLEEIKNLRIDMNRRFEAIDKRFEENDKRFQQLITDMNRRFEENDKRFQQLITDMNRRFEAIDKRFEENDKRFQQLITNMNQRFEKLITEMNQRFEKVDERFEVLEYRTMRMEAAIGSLSGSAGINMERLILKIMKKALELRNIDIEKVEKFGMWDKDGKLLKHKGKVTFDGYFHNSEHILMEIKFTARESDVIWFSQRCDFFESESGIKPKRLLVAVNVRPDVITLCKNLGIELIYENIQHEP